MPMGEAIIKNFSCSLTLISIMLLDVNITDSHYMMAIFAMLAAASCTHNARSCRLDAA